MRQDEVDEVLGREYDNIMQAVSAEDVFGIFPTRNEEEQAKLLEQRYEELSTIFDPQQYSNPDEADLAEDAKQKLAIFFEKAKNRIALGAYGLSRNRLPNLHGRPAIKTAKREYYLGEIVAEGDLATIYRGDCLVGDDFAGQVAIKVIDDPATNHLMENEIRILNLLHSQNAPQRKHLPTLLDRFRTDQGQNGIILRYLDECYTLAEVRERYPNGLDRKHVVWILNRLLSVIGYLHSQNITHNHINPDHLMIRPRDHNLFLLDHSYATLIPKSVTGEGFKAIDEDFSPPEISAAEGFPSPSTDIYSAGLCMIYLLGGNVKKAEVPAGIEDELARFLETMTMKSQLQRKQDAWQLHHQLGVLVVKLWGPKRFLNLAM